MIPASASGTTPTCKTRVMQRVRSFGNSLLARSVLFLPAPELLVNGVGLKTSHLHSGTTTAVTHARVIVSLVARTANPSVFLVWFEDVDTTFFEHEQGLLTLALCTPPFPPSLNLEQDGALVQQRDSDIPVAKLAEDNWVTAMAFAGAQPNPESDPVTYGSTSTTTTTASTSTREGGGSEGQEEEEQSWSVSRWRSARATARQARRLNNISGGSRSGRGGDGVVLPPDATTAAYMSTPAAGQTPSGGMDAAGGRASRREPPPPVVLGNDLERPGEP